MNPIPNNVDWSATAAWISLVISITGTILGPIITTILTNRHQLKLRRLDLQEKSISEKYSVIKNVFLRLVPALPIRIQSI